jgi:peptidoglycan/LPS O-acetylase OafA/YrhL
MRKRFQNLFFPHDHKEEHFKALDGLRGVAVLIVLLSHTSNAHLYFHEWLNFGRVGKVGVFLFFLLSAYLLDRQIAIAYLSNKSSLQYWKNYFLRRFLRIYPLFILTVIVCALFTAIGLPTLIEGVEDVLMHIFLMRGKSVFWSIPVEFKYYFISPFLMWICHRYLKWDVKKVLFFFVGLIIISIVIESLFHLSSLSTLRYFPVFLVGTLISIYELLKKDVLSVKISPLTYEILGILSLVLMLLTIPYYFNLIFDAKIKDFHNHMYYLPYSVLWGVILLSTKYGYGFITKIFELKVFRFIGTISFSLYLLHPLALRFVLWNPIDMPEYLRIYVFFVVIVIVSILSYLMIERPLSKIKIYNKKIVEKDINKPSAN